MNITLRDYQIDIVNKLRQAYRQGFRAPLLQSVTGSGKCLGEGTPVLMYDGTIRKVEEIRVGDILMGPDSDQRIVISTCEGREMLYGIAPVKGDAYTVNESHILSLKRTARTFNDKRRGEIVNISVADYITTNKSFKHFHKGWRTAVDFPIHPDAVLIDPYFLGIWLGDGDRGRLTITTPDDDIVKYIDDYSKTIGMHTRIEYNSENSVRVQMRYDINPCKRGGYLMNAMREYNLIKNKHIPHRYKTGSRAERLYLLAGILDADGHYTKCGYDLIFKNERLMDDTIFIARSLGYAAYKSPCRKTCCNNGVTGTYYRCNITGNVDEIPCRLKRKKAAQRQQKKNHLVTGIKSVIQRGVGKYYGFELSGADGLFLLGDFTVTHNTAVYCHIAEKAVARGKRILILVHRRELLFQNSDMLDSMAVAHGIIAPGFSHSVHQVQVGSVQTVRNRLDKMQKPDLIIVDECFVAGTLVDCGGIGSRPIESIKAGDYVASFNHDDGYVEYHKVTNTFNNTSALFTILTTYGGHDIVCTPNHPIFNVGANCYIPAKAMSQGDIVFIKNHGIDCISSIRNHDYGKRQSAVYNLEVEGNNNYFANGVLVHNCHHTSAGSWNKIITHYPQALLLGVTATPCRLDGQGLGKEHGGFYDTLVCGPSMKDLISRGYLSPPRIFAPPNNIDHSKFHIKYGDYDKHEIEAVLDNPKIVGDAISHYIKYSADKPAIAFCVSVEAAEKVAARFNEAGIASECIHGNCDNARRKYCIKGLADGRIKVLTSCEIISEGIDVPVVSTAILLRPTKSTGLYLQQVGRVLRPYPGKEYSIILDHVGNVYLHGSVDMDRGWTLAGSDRLERKKGDPKTFWQCKFCYAINDIRRFSCVACGEVKETADRIIPEIDGELQEIEQERLRTEYERMAKHDKKRSIAMARTLEELEAAQWARILFAARQRKMVG